MSISKTLLDHFSGAQVRRKHYDDRLAAFKGLPVDSQLLGKSLRKSYIAEFQDLALGTWLPNAGELVGLYFAATHYTESVLSASCIGLGAFALCECVRQWYNGAVVDKLSKQSASLDECI